MKQFFLLLLLAASLRQASAQRATAPVDILHYSFDITLSDSSNRIDGIATIRFTALQPTQYLELDLASLRKDGKGMRLQGVYEGKHQLDAVHENDRLRITLVQHLQKGDSTEVEIRYSGIPADGLIIANNKYGQRGFFADHWPNRGHQWLPCIDHPADKAPVDFIVTAPEHFQVVANGIQVEESSLGRGLKRTHYRETVPLPTKVMVIGVADFAVQLAGNVDCIPVYSWVYPQDRDKGFFDYAQAASILPWYIKKVGPYGYGKLANVQSKTRFGGLENASTIFYSEGSVTGTRRSESLLAHEIAHQWFGNMATETDWAHLWLSEGFATYMTIVYMEEAHGKDTATQMLRTNRQQVISFAKTKPAPVVDKSVTDYMQLLNANSYQKGGWVLHMLRNELGDTDFWKVIRSYYQQYAGRNASTEDLQKVVESVSGKNWSVFFNQWLYRAGQPQLSIIPRYNAGKKSLEITINQEQPALFEFPLELSVLAKGTTISKTVHISNKTTTVSLPMRELPTEIIVDPNTRLLFEGRVLPLQ